MRRTLFVFRPEPGWSATVKAARSTGLDVDGAPLFAIEPVVWDAPDPAQFGGLLLGSANVIRHGSTHLARFKRLPVYAVGRATADAARAAGFTVEQVGKGGLQSLLDGLAGQKLKLLRLAGDARVAVSPPAGITLMERTVYRATLIQIESELADRLQKAGVVALHSGNAAQAFRRECKRLEIDRSVLTVAALFPRIAELAGEGWESVHIAAAPRDIALLALVRALCQIADGESSRQARTLGRGNGRE